MSFAQNVIWPMALGTAALDVVLVACIIALFNRSWRQKIVALVRTHGRLVVFLLSFVSIIATLWMQYGDNLAPCVFCWYQRIAMYPIALITGIAAVKNVDFSEIADYILGLSIIGAGFAMYQHLLQILPQGALIPCSATDECAVRSVFEFGYITLPWMALSVFATIIFICLIARRKKAL